MRFVLTPTASAREEFADMKDIEVWSYDIQNIQNDISIKEKAVRNQDGSIRVDKDGEPVMESEYKVVLAKIPEDWLKTGYDHKEDRIAPIYNPDYKNPHTGGVMGWSNSIRKAAKGIENSGHLRLERKVKTTLKTVTFKSIVAFVDFITKHELTISKEAYDYKFEDGSNCVMLYQEWNEFDSY